MNDLLVLTNVRLNSLVVFTTAGGYYMGAVGPIDPLLMLNACVGTALVASGAAALNQIHEREIDGLMVRTRNRPMVQGRMGLGQANLWAYGLAALNLTTTLGSALVTVTGWVALVVGVARMVAPGGTTSGGAGVYALLLAMTVTGLVLTYEAYAPGARAEEQDEEDERTAIG